MKESEDPVRWLLGGEDAPAGFAALVAKDDAVAPSAVELARSFDGLARALGRPELGQALRAELAGSGSGAAIVGHAGLYGKVALAIALGLGAAGVLWQTHARGPRADARATRHAQLGAPAPSPVLPSAAAAVPQSNLESPRVSSAPVAAPTPSASPVIAAQVRTRAPARASRVAKPSDPAAELALLERAQQALRADPALALSLAEQHKQRFAAGQFEPEREMLAIEALVRLGKNAAARERGRRFLRAHPESSYRPRLEDLLAGAK